MSPADLLGAAAILFVGATLQSAIGFGIGLVCVPLFLLAGWSLPAIVATVLGAGLVQAALAAHEARASLPWRASLEVASAQWVMAPVGVFAMAALLRQGPSVVRPLVGVAVLILLSLRFFPRARPRASLPLAWGFAAGGASGLLAGTFGLGGPPLVLYALAHDWNKDVFRGFLWLQFLIGLPILLGALVMRMGPSVLRDFALAVGLAPVVWAGTRLGLQITRRWRSQQVTWAASLALFVLAVSGILQALWNGSGS